MQSSDRSWPDGLSGPDPRQSQAAWPKPVQMGTNGWQPRPESQGKKGTHSTALVIWMPIASGAGVLRLLMWLSAIRMVASRSEHSRDIVYAPPLPSAPSLSAFQLATKGMFLRWPSGHSQKVTSVQGPTGNIYFT